MARDLEQSSYEDIFGGEKGFKPALFHKDNFGEVAQCELDRIQRHRFVLFSSESKKLINYQINKSNQEYSKKVVSMIAADYEMIDWQIDFRSGFRWEESEWYKNIKIAPKEGADIKYPWELGRMQHLPLLAVNGLSSEFENQILDFIAMNPPRFGVQWKCAMDVGIRAVSWCVSYDIFMQKGIKFEVSFNNIFFNSLLLHKKHIEQNIEWSGGARGNHYFANICSLIILSKYFKQDTSKWIKILEQEVLYQFNPDGGNFEASLPYHFFALDMLVTTLRVLESDSDLDILLNKNVKSRLGNILEFSESCHFSSGIPQIGDNDGGVYVNLSREDQSLFNIIFLKNFLGQNSFNNNQNEVGSFPDFGIYIFKTECYQFAFRCGSVGQKGKGGHSHNDQLSFVLSSNEEEIFVDAGTYNYTGLPKERNHFRSTKQHNTLIVSGLEQNDWDSDSIDDLFWIRKDKAKAKVEKAAGNSILANHYAYGVKCQREVKLFPSEILFSEKCEIAQKKYVHLHIHPKFNKLIKVVSNKVIINNMLEIEFSKDYAIEIENYFYSKTYGKKEIAKRIKINLRGNKLKWKINISNSKANNNAD